MIPKSLPHPIHGLSLHVTARRAFFTLSFTLLLLSAGALQSAEPAFSGTELRDNFPAQGEEQTQPEFQGGWEYYAEQSGTRLDTQPFIWEYHSPERWPEGRLKSGSAFIMHDSAYEDALVVVPGSNETDTIVQWTAPVDGSFQVDGWFQKIQKTPDLAPETDGVELLIRGPDGNELEKFTSGLEDTEIKSFSFKLSNMKAGETLAFVVHANRVNWGNETRLSARVVKE